MDFEGFATVVLRSMADALVYADAAGTIRYWNAAAERMFGFTAAEALGQRLDIIVPELLRRRHWEGYDKTMRTGHSRYGEGDLLAVPAIRKDGSRISIEFTITPFRDDAGDMVGIAAVIRDVTKRFEEMQALRRRVGASELSPHLPPGAAHQDLRVRAGDRRVIRHRRRPTCRRPGRCSSSKLLIAVLAAHQRRAVVAAGDLAHIGRDVADREADAPVVRRVGIGAVDQPHVVQRHLAGARVPASPPRARRPRPSISWPRDSRLSAAKVSRCGTWSSLCVPGITRIAPFAAVLSVNATQAVTTSGGSRPQ